MEIVERIGKVVKFAFATGSCFHYVVDVTGACRGQVWFLDIEGKFVPRCDRRTDRRS